MLAKDVKRIVYNYTREPGLERALSLVAVRPEAVENLYEHILKEVFHRVSGAQVAGSHSTQVRGVTLIQLPLATGIPVSDKPRQFPLAQAISCF